jgi:gas vesicle protein
VFTEIYKTEGARVRESIDAKIKKMVNELNDLLVVANEQMRYYNHMDDLSDKYAEASKTLGGKVDNVVSRLKTEHRRTFYENQQSSLVEHITKFLSFFYWLAVFAWVIVIIYRAKYGNYKNIALTVAFIVFPFMADTIITWLFQIMLTIYKALPTDAYLDMN